jgi:hypothetical protein
LCLNRITESAFGLGCCQTRSLFPRSQSAWLLDGYFLRHLLNSDRLSGHRAGHGRQRPVAEKGQQPQKDIPKCSDDPTGMGLVSRF